MGMISQNVSPAVTPQTAAERPLVSVVIPTYNRGPYLKRAITSVLRQDHVGEMFDLEIIIVDDCSPDDMSHIAAAFPDVQYMRLPTNRGASGARNAGIKRATGKYVALLDDDDEFLAHKLQVQVPVLEANPDVGVVYGQSVVTGSDVPLLLWPEWGPSGRVFEEFLTRTDDFLHPPTWLVRRELFDQAGYFDEKNRTMEHYDMALRLASITSWRFLAGGPVARGRFSKQGKWYTNILNGTNERRLPHIIENALTRLPVTPEADSVRRKARAAVCATIAGQRWSIGGGLEPTQSYMLSSLRAAPWLLREPVVMAWVHRIAATLASASRDPVQAVKDFWKDITQVIASDPSAYHGPPRRLLGAMLEATALDMRRHSPRRPWLVAMSAVFHDPGYWLRPGRLFALVRELSSR